MPDQENTTQTPPVPASAVALSDHAEDVLADTIGHELELSVDESGAPLKTVQQVLHEIGDDKDELSITLEYGTGESGVDQASWEIEVTSLQRAFMRQHKQQEIDALSKQIKDEIKVLRSRADSDWVDRTSELRSLLKVFEQPQVARQVVDDYQHRIFGRDKYLAYLEAVLAHKDEGKLLNASSNLRQVAQQLEADHDALIDPSGVDNTALADMIIAHDSDIDVLSRELERNISSARFRREIGLAARISDIINEEYIKKYKLWAHSFDLNMREVLATERSANNGSISDKARRQLKDMLEEGATQINQLLQVIQ